MASYLINISISKGEWLKVYNSYSRYVFCQASDGTRLKIPVKHFLPFVTSQGVEGAFWLELGENNKFLSIKRV